MTKSFTGSMSRSFSANAPAPASRLNIAIKRGKIGCRQGLEQKQLDVASSHDYLEDKDGSSSHDAYALASSQSVACEVVWDCVSPGPPVAIDECNGSSTPGEGNAIRRLRKRSSMQRTPARSLHPSAAKAKKSAGVDAKADTVVSSAKCSARLLFFKNVPSHDKDVKPSLLEQDKVEAMDIMDLSPIACLSSVEAEVAAADRTAATAGPLATAVATVTAVSPPTTTKMNQSFSCKNSANKGRCNDRMDSFDDDNSLFSESIIQSTEAIEEALFDKSKNKFISPAAVGKVLSKIQPVVLKGKLAKVKQCNTPSPQHEIFSKGANCRSVEMSSNCTQNSIKPLQKQESNLKVNKQPNHLTEINMQMKNQQKEAYKVQVDASQLLAKPLLAEGSKYYSGLLRNTENGVVNVNIGNNRRQQSECSSGYKSCSASGGDAIATAVCINNEDTNKQKFTAKSSFAIDGTAIADKSILSKVASSAGGRNGYNQTKMLRSRSVYNTASVQAAMPGGMATAVRRVNSDSAVPNFSDSDPEFDEIASSIPDNEEMLMPWSQQLLQKTRLKLNSNKSMQKQLSCIQEVLNKSIQRSEGSQGDCLNSQQPPKGVTSSHGHQASRSSTTGLTRHTDTDSVSEQLTSTVSQQLLDDAGFFDDGFEMEDDELNNLASQIEEEYVSASQAGAAASHEPCGSAGQRFEKAISKDKVSSLNNRRNSPLSEPNHRKQLNSYSKDQSKESRLTFHTNFPNRCSAPKGPINTVPKTIYKPSADLNIIPPSQIDSSSTNHNHESTPYRAFSFRKHSSQTDSSSIEPKNIRVIGHTNVGPTPLSGHQRAASTTNRTGAVAGNPSGPGVGFARPPTSTNTQSGSAATSRVAPSSGSLFSLPAPTISGGGQPCAEPGTKTKYTKEQIAFKKAQAIERQKALLQRKATKGGAL